VGLVTTATLQTPAELARRNRRFGVFSVFCAALMAGVFATVPAGSQATFVLTAARGELIELPNLVVGVTPAVLVMAAAVLAIAVVQFTRGFGSRTVLMGAVVAALLVAAFLTWAAAGDSVSLISLFRGTVRSATPIALGAMCGVMCERAGVINIAIEGQLVAGAFTAAITSTVFASAWIGLGGGIAAGMLIGGMFALLTIKFRAEHIVSGVVLWVLAVGTTSFLATQVLGRDAARFNTPVRFPTIEIRGLSQIPILGPVLFRHTIIGYAMFIAVALLAYALFQTRWGLRLRSVGEHPKAADTVGIKVLATRYKAVILGGAFAGIGGAWFTLDATGQFSREMSGGRGFIALAAMLVGRYSPVGAFGAALLFGFASGLATSVQQLPVPIPSTLMLTAPYLITILVVAGLVGRLRPPAATGKPYVKE
jgi:general nucleoside transport system permease protein